MRASQALVVANRVTRNAAGRGLGGGGALCVTRSLLDNWRAPVCRADTQETPNPWGTQHGWPV
jgi:hypothetical protein